MNGKGKTRQAFMRLSLGWIDILWLRGREVVTVVVIKRRKRNGKVSVTDPPLGLLLGIFFIP